MKWLQQMVHDFRSSSRTFSQEMIIRNSKLFKKKFTKKQFRTENCIPPNEEQHHPNRTTEVWAPLRSFGTWPGPRGRPKQTLFFSIAAIEHIEKSWKMSQVSHHIGVHMCVFDLLPLWWSCMISYVHVSEMPLDPKYEKNAAYILSASLHWKKKELDGPGLWRRTHVLEIQELVFFDLGIHTAPTWQSKATTEPFEFQCKIDDEVNQQQFRKICFFAWHGFYMFRKSQNSEIGFRFQSSSLLDLMTWDMAGDRWSATKTKRLFFIGPFVGCLATLHLMQCAAKHFGIQDTNQNGNLDFHQFSGRLKFDKGFNLTQPSSNFVGHFKFLVLVVLELLPVSLSSVSPKDNKVMQLRALKGDITKSMDFFTFQEDLRGPSQKKRKTGKSANPAAPPALWQCPFGSLLRDSCAESTPEKQLREATVSFKCKNRVPKYQICQTLLENIQGTIFHLRKNQGENSVTPDASLWCHHWRQPQNVQRQRVHERIPQNLYVAYIDINVFRISKKRWYCFRCFEGHKNKTTNKRSPPFVVFTQLPVQRFASIMPSASLSPSSMAPLSPLPDTLSQNSSLGQKPVTSSYFGYGFTFGEPLKRRPRGKGGTFPTTARSIQISVWSSSTGKRWFFPGTQWSSQMTRQFPTAWSSKEFQRIESNRMASYSQDW